MNETLILTTLIIVWGIIELSSMYFDYKEEDTEYSANVAETPDEDPRGDKE